MKTKIEQYLKLQNEIEDLADNIFDYVYQNFIELLEFGRYSTAEDFSVEKRGITIKYYDQGYDLYETNNLFIPIEYIINDTWKEYIQGLEEKRINKNIEKLEKENAYKREQELKLLKELKEKYES